MTPPTILSQTGGSVFTCVFPFGAEDYRAGCLCLQLWSRDHNTHHLEASLILDHAETQALLRALPATLLLAALAAQGWAQEETIHGEAGH